MMVKVALTSKVRSYIRKKSKPEETTHKQTQNNISICKSMTTNDHHT